MARQVGIALGVSVLVTIVDRPDLEAAFTRAWYAVAAAMILAALTALRMSSVAAVQPEPVAVAA